MDKEKEIDIQYFVSMVAKAQEEAIKRLIEANTIVIDSRLRYVKPFVAALEQSAICFPPMIMGMELKFADLPNNADFLLFKADKTAYERMVQDIKKQAVKEFAEKFREQLEQYRLDNEYFTADEPNGNLWQMNSSVFYLEVIDKGGLIDELVKGYTNG